MRNWLSCCITAEENVHLKSLKKSIQEYEKSHGSLPSGFTSLYKKTKTDSDKIRYINREIARLDNGGITCDIFTFSELCAATQNFDLEKLIGEGGFGRVYKAHIERNNIDVAVKQLDRNGFQGNNEFLVELLVLNLLRHPNLINLVGYCVEGRHRILVYEYMPNGSLEDCLFNASSNMKPLDWETRMKIAEGAARGLEYLHETANPPVTYRDFKTSNILLDASFNPKLSDFGLAKLGPIGDNSDTSTRVMGTCGYCAPEYASTGWVTTKSDVYSLSVVLLEMICGRRVIDTSRPQQEQNLITWVWPLLKDKKKIHQVTDPRLRGNYPIRGLYQALTVALTCLDEDPNNRPLICNVIVALNHICTCAKEECSYDGDNGNSSTSNEDDRDEKINKYDDDNNST